MVFDTSALVRMIASRSGLLGLKLAASQGLVIITSDYLLQELDRTLRRHFGHTRQRAHATTRAFAKLAQRVPIAPADIQNYSRDPTDDPVIAAALVARAEFLVSSNLDLLDLQTVDQLTIISYADFLDTLSALVNG